MCLQIFVNCVWWKTPAWCFLAKTCLFMQIDEFKIVFYTICTSALLNSLLWKERIQDLISQFEGKSWSFQSEWFYLNFLLILMCVCFFLKKQKPKQNYHRAVVCRHLSLLRMYLSRTFQTCQEQNCRSEPGSSAPPSRSTCSISSASAPASSSGRIFKGVSSVGAKGAQFLQTVSKNVCNKGIINRWVIHSHFSVATSVRLSLGVEGSYNWLLTMQNPSITVTSFPRGSSKGRRARKLEQISTVRHPPVEQNTEIQALQSCWLQQALLTWRKKKKSKALHT